MNELIKRSDAILIIQNTNYKYPTWPHIVEAKENMIRDVKSAPTADVVPVVRGEWVLVGTNEHDYETSVEEKCSLCGRCVYRYDTQPQDNYCPNCGAKMEVKE